MDNEKVTFLREELKGLKSRYKSDRQRHKRTALWIKLGTAIFAGVATVLLGWQQPPAPELFQNIALVLNAGITIIIAYEIFFEPRKLWARETFVFSQLKDIERDLEYELAGTSHINEERLDEIKNKIHDVLNKSLEEWHKDKRDEN